MNIMPGDQFGDLTVIERAGKDACNYILWRCACVCGSTADVRSARLRTGKTKSCGCRRAIGNTHFTKVTAPKRVGPRHTDHPAYQIHAHRHHRATWPPEWENRSEFFRAVLPSWEPDTDLTARIPELPLSASNWCWQPRLLRVQQMGRTGCRPVVINGTLFPSLRAAHRALNINYWALHSRIRSANFPDYKYASEGAAA